MEPVRAILAGIAALLLAPVALADEPVGFAAYPGGCPGDTAGPDGPLLWRFGWCATALLVAGGLTSTFLLGAPNHSHWQGKNDFDEAIRNALRAGSRSARDDYAAASDGLLATMVIAPHLDAALYGWSLADDPESQAGRWRLFELMEQTNFNLQSASLVFTSVFKATVGRERPYVRKCATDPHYASGCGDSNAENSSFFSGHTASAFTGAGLVCARHARFEYGAPIDAEPHWGWDDTLACGASVAGATATGLLRIAADEHYGTDVIAGAVSGFAFGFLVPYLWEREAWGQPMRRDTSWLVMPEVDHGAVGLAAVVRF